MHNYMYICSHKTQSTSETDTAPYERKRSFVEGVTGIFLLVYSVYRNEYNFLFVRISWVFFMDDLVSFQKSSLFETIFRRWMRVRGGEKTEVETTENSSHRTSIYVIH